VVLIITVLMRGFRPSCHSCPCSRSLPTHAGGQFSHKRLLDLAAITGFSGLVLSVTLYFRTVITFRIAGRPIGPVQERRQAMCRSKAEGGRRCKPKSGRGFPAAVDSTSRSATPGPSGLMRRSRAAVLKDAQEQLGDLLDAIVDGAPVDSAAALVSAADVDVADQVAEAITASLQTHGCPRGKWRRHLLCGALAAVAQAMEAGEKLAKTVVTKGVTAALTSCGVPRLAAGLAARAAVGTLMKMPPARNWEDVRRAVQLLAVSMCPNVANHPAVEQYCLRPLASQFLSDVIQAELGTLPGGDSAAAG
jgi:hypothetical protein